MATASSLGDLVRVNLPLAPRLPDVVRAVAGQESLVLRAEPGAGKTSLVPLALAFSLEGKVLVLEPRRVAAVQSAWRAAELAGEAPGGRVGYRVRGDSRKGSRVEFVTEGVFLRLVQDDPSLEGVAAVVFDEFHERSLGADLGLALALESRAAMRPDLRIVVMSATLAAGRIAAHVGGSVLEVEGRCYPVATGHVGPGFPASAWGPRLDEALAAEARSLIRETEGDLLVFLPGAREIARVGESLQAMFRGEPGAPAVLPLHASLPLERQRQAIMPREGEGRRVILATSVAETSLTVPRVSAVLDSGLARLSRFQARAGLNRLVTEREASDRAEQRRGRAGRLGPGRCLRAWPAGEILAERTEAEILRAELSGLVLEAAVWGARSPDELPWLDAPPRASWDAAADLLRELGALDQGGGATGFGRRCARLGTEPRLAALVLRGAERGRVAEAAALAALLAEGAPSGEADLGAALEELRRGGPGGGLGGRGGLDGRGAQGARSGSGGRGSEGYGRIREEAARLESVARSEGATRAGGAAGTGDVARPGAAAREASLGALLAAAFPDRVARRVEARGADAAFQLPGGRKLRARGALAASPWIVAAEADYGAAGEEGPVYSGAALGEGEALEALAPFIEEVVELEWAGLVPRARARRRAGAILLSESPLPSPTRREVADALCDRVIAEGIGILPWGEGTRSPADLLARLRWYGRVAAPGSWPALDGEGLASGARGWLAPFAGIGFSEGGGAKGNARESRGAAPAIDEDGLRAALEALVPPGAERAFRRDAPAEFELPSGRVVGLDYSGPETGPGGQPLGPALVARPADFYGLAVHPRIAGLPILVHLVSPANRPIHTTADLPAFWRGAWAETRKDLRGRYPKHDWPEDPAAARPSASSVKRKPAR